MFRRRLVLVAAAALASVPLALASGCDWFKASESGQRLSPYISSLNIVSSKALCAGGFAVSFRYDDLQGDIESALLTPQHSGESAEPAERVLWPADQSPSAGVAELPLTFTCRDPKPEGRWTVTVQLEDQRGHLSNKLSAEIRY